MRGLNVLVEQTTQLQSSLQEEDLQVKRVLISSSFKEGGNPSLRTLITSLGKSENSPLLSIHEDV